MLAWAAENGSFCYDIAAFREINFKYDESNKEAWVKAHTPTLLHSASR